jgi:hypothetical protein
LKDEDMDDPRRSIDAMITDVTAGRTPEMLMAFLRLNFARVEGGWLRRTLFGERSYDVWRVELCEDGGFFRRSCLFRVFANDNYLAGTVLPSGGSYGLFALGEAGLQYLNHRHDLLEDVFRRESRPLQEGSPNALARMLVESVGLNGWNSHDVIDSLEGLRGYRGGPEAFGGGYHLDMDEWAHVAGSLVSPSVSGDGRSGWTLECCTVYGAMHCKNDLIRHRFAFTTDFRIQHDSTSLSGRIFKRVPMVTY